jgi:long-chain acyl-CoA synthetase
VRGGLAPLGVAAGDRVVLLCGNNRYFVLAYLATLGLGAVAVPLNPASPAPEIERELATVGAKVVVLVEPLAAHGVEQVDRAATCRHRRARDRGPSAGTIDGADTRSTTARARPTRRSSTSIPTRSRCSCSPAAPPVPPRRDAQPRQPARQPRAGPVHRTCRSTPDDVVYGVLPLFHIFGLNVVLGLTLARGATVVLVQRFDPVHRARHDRERRSPSCPAHRRCGWRSATSTRLPADSFATCGSRSPARRACPRRPCAARSASASTCARATASPRPRRSSPARRACPSEVRLGRQGARRHRGAARRRDGDDVVAGDSRRDLGRRAPNVFRGYWHDEEADRPGAHRPTAGCAPATSPRSTTTATCTWSTGPRI